MDTIDKNKKGKLYSASITALVVGLVVAAIFFTVGRKRDKYYLVTQGVEAPNFTLPTIDGDTITLTDYRGEVLLINMWATWCPACIEEMPSMEKLYKDFKGSNSQFDLLAVNVDSSNTIQLKEFVKKMNITFPVLYDTSGQIPYTYKIIGLPESYIVDKKGVIRKKIIGGYNWDTLSTRHFIEELLKEER